MKKVLIIAVTIVAVVALSAALGNVLLASAQGGQLPIGQNGTCPMTAAGYGAYTCPLSGTLPGGMMGGWGMMGGRGMMGMHGVYTGTLPYGAPGGMMGGRGMMGMHGAMMGQNWPGANGMHEQVWTAVAKKLGMTYAELNAATQNGQTVAQLAQAKSVALDDLKAAAKKAMKDSLAGLVKQGVMTQEQADWMADHMDDMPMFNFGQGFGPGMMNGRGMMHGHGMMRGYQLPAGPQG